MNNNNKIQKLIDKQEIYEVLTRYCQGVDRCDVELIKSVYHEDAQEETESHRAALTTTAHL